MEEVNYEITVNNEYDMMVKMIRCVQLYIKRYGKTNVGMMSIRILKDAFFINDVSREESRESEESEDRTHLNEENCMIDNDVIAVTIARQELYKGIKMNSKV